MTTAGEPPKILHLITGLGPGGAEAMLAKLVTHDGRSRHMVVSLLDGGTVGPGIERAGIPLFALGLNRPVALPRAIAGLAARIRHWRPDIVQGWLNHGNLAATMLSTLAGARVPLVWNVRQSIVDWRHEKWLTRRIIRLNARLSNRPAAIIYNSCAGAAQHEAIGFIAGKRRLIPNGFDVQRFFPDEHLRRATRAKLGIADDEIAVGLIARYHSMKNHEGFLEAGRIILRAQPKVRFVLAGEGTGADGNAANVVAAPEVRERTLFLGLRTDVPDITRALDIACNVSLHGEGFPNAIGEAMASAVPCVVTAIGDSAVIIGETGVVCSDGSPEAIARAVLQLAGDPSHMRSLGQQGRNRVMSHYSLPSIVRQYDELYYELAARR